MGEQMYKFEQEKKTSFSLRKIPEARNEEFFIEEQSNFDKIKILELSNSVDKWEEELLLSNGGFFSLKGKEVQGKTKEFFKDLNDFISRKIAELKLEETVSKEIVFDVKRKKLQVIKNKMQVYENEQMKNWVLSVFEEALDCSIRKAVFYKNNLEIVQLSLNNAFEILKLMAEQEDWNEKTFNQKKLQFEEKFYLSLINAFVSEKDINAEIFFEKVKEKISLKEREKLEDSLKQLKQQIIAFNFSKELYSYKLQRDEIEEEIKKIKDSEIEKFARKFLRDFEEDDKKNKEKNENTKNEENWKEVISKLEEDSQKAILYIDTTLSKESQKAKKDYIEQIRKDGYITTDVKIFSALFKEFLKNIETFKNKNISDFRAHLSKEDFSLISKLKETSLDEYTLLYSDYNFLQKGLIDNKKNDEKSVYDIIKLFLAGKNSYILINKKEMDLEHRNKLIEAILERSTRKD